MTDSKQNTMRFNTYQLFKNTAQGMGHIVNIALIVLIVLNVVTVFIASIPQIGLRYHNLFYIFEGISIALFTVEYIARLWSSAEEDPRHPNRSRWHYIFSPLAIIDLIAILPFYIGIFFAIDIRYLMAARLFRVLKLTRHSASLTTLFKVLKNEGPAIFSALSILILLIIFSSAAMYLVERTAQPDKFGSIPEAMWWASITLTTVGYGDVVPITVFGKILGIIITILGVGIAALPAGIIASGFNTEMRNRRDEFQAKVMSVMVNGQLDDDATHMLTILRVKLGLSVQESKALIRITSYQRNHQSHQSNYCKHCGETLN